MILNNIREQIKVILQGVTGIGVVHDYHRWAIDERKLLSLFQDTDGKINACTFGREQMAKRKIVIGSGALERAHVWMIRCVMGLKDDKATGIAFDNLLMAIESAFEGHDDLNGVCLTINPGWGPMSGASGVQIERVDEIMLARTVLCHYAELRLCTIERNER